MIIMATQLELTLARVAVAERRDLSVLQFKPNEEAKDRQLLTREDLCQRLKISKRTVSRLLAGGKIPPPVRLGHSVRWRADEIDEWILRGCPAVDRNGRKR